MNAIYIHIPFCKSKCFYCDFNSYANKEEMVSGYFDALTKEIKNFSFEDPIRTIYIGGGTPSFVDEKYIVSILNILPTAEEITIEMNPGTVSEKKLTAYQQAGINRVSLGLQATQNSILKDIGRIHTKEEFEEAFFLCRKQGFHNINVDLMHGLPNQSLSDFQESIDYLISLNPEHISCYSLILHDTIFQNLPSEEEERSMYYYAKETLKKNGYHHYEISNFAREGKESKHNLVYWNQEEYIGFGAGASSYIDGKRFTNVPNLEAYIDKINGGNQSYVIEEIQEEESKIKEYMILKLRLIQGIDITEMNQKFHINVLERFKNEFEKLQKQDLIQIDSHIYLTDKGLDLANIVWEELVK